MPFASPQSLIEQFEVYDGLNVADLGVGSGHFTRELAKQVGEGGRVYAVDIQIGLLERIKAELNAENLNNVEIVVGDLDEEGGSNLASSSVERAVASNIFFQLENRDIFIEEIDRILKPGGRVLVVEWSEKSELGPSGDRVFSIDQAKKMFEKYGFKKEKELNAGSHHYGIIFRKSPR